MWSLLAQSSQEWRKQTVKMSNYHAVGALQPRHRETYPNSTRDWLINQLAVYSFTLRGTEVTWSERSVLWTVLGKQACLLWSFLSCFHADLLSVSLQCLENNSLLDLHPGYMGVGQAIPSLFSIPGLLLEWDGVSFSQGLHSATDPQWLITGSPGFYCSPALSLARGSRFIDAMMLRPYLQVRRGKLKGRVQKASAC